MFYFLFLILVSLLCVTLCFFGYRHIRLLFTGIGLLFGGYYTYTLLLKYATLSQTTSIIIAVLVGLLLGGLAYFIYNFGIFLTGAAFGICVAIMIMNLVGVPVDSTLPTVIIVVLAVCAGFSRWPIAGCSSCSPQRLPARLAYLYMAALRRSA